MTSKPKQFAFVHARSLAINKTTREIFPVGGYQIQFRAKPDAVDVPMRATSWYWAPGKTWQILTWLVATTRIFATTLMRVRHQSNGSDLSTMLTGNMAK